MVSGAILHACSALSIAAFKKSQKKQLFYLYLPSLRGIFLQLLKNELEMLVFQRS